MKSFNNPITKVMGLKVKASNHKNLFEFQCAYVDLMGDLCYKKHINSNVGGIKMVKKVKNVG
jgi:hypothetical protein